MPNGRVSLYWELRALLYLGVLMLCAGLGIWIYQHVDSISHLMVTAAITLLCAGGFAWCVFLRGREAPGYAVLLSCLTFAILVGHVQYEYRVFGESMRTACFLSLVVFALSAYYFDNIAVLHLAIVAFSAWIAVLVIPFGEFAQGDFNDTALIWTMLGLGAFLEGLSVLHRPARQPFAFAYAHFGIYFVLTACVFGMFYRDEHYALGWFIPLLGACAYYFWKALRWSSSYFLVVLTAFGYIGICERVFDSFDLYGMAGDLYFIFSGTGLIVFLLWMSRKMKVREDV